MGDVSAADIFMLVFGGVSLTVGLVVAIAVVRLTRRLTKAGLFDEDDRAEERWERQRKTEV